MLQFFLVCLCLDFVYGGFLKQYILFPWWCLYFKVKCCLTQKDSGLREIYGNLAIE